MNLERVREIARERGVKPGRMKKGEMIRAMQAREGNPACYDTGRIAACAEMGCLWREDCR